MPLAIDFLQSLMCLCTDYTEVDINVIVPDSGEVDAFRGAVDNLTSCGDTFSIFPVPPNNVNGPKANVHIINMFDILPPVFHSITIKKLAAAATLEYDYALWLDSESIVVQPFSIRQMFDTYVAATTVWRWRNTNHDVMRDMMSGSAGMLNRTIESFGPAFWNLESQEWIIEKTVIDDLFQYVEMVHSQDFWSAWATHGAPFEITLYNMHIQSRKLETTDPMFTKYRILESEMEMEKYGVLSASSQYVKEAMTQIGLLERSWLFLQVPGVAQKLSKMLRNYSLQLYRLDDLDIAPPEVINRFLLDTPIHFLCSGAPPLHSWWEGRNKFV
ncbi:hypothetical protein CDEST_07260 [Colletotrichum destructivum]|uniref:Uncharacterized protein n=1 Tax=Colletotrichum destructivum TaxID=34406 RepID=A0AAX4IGL2_9PEZI|nr:hypothetical protein CDEST_07260 [Colletotrichum destructivum]